MNGTRRSHVYQLKRAPRRASHRYPAAHESIRRGPQATARAPDGYTAHSRSIAPPRVECVRHRMRPLHGDTVRQESIEAAHPRKLGALDVRIKMNNLLQRMHAGIGTARGDG